MKYPHTLNQKISEVREIVSSWNVEIPIDDVIKWIMQFDSLDFDLAFRIIKNLNIIGYDELKSALHVAYSKLERKAIDKNTKFTDRNTLFAGIGEGGKSGAMVSYNFRLTNELSEENFLNESSFSHLEKGRIENIVLVDDIISTGRQATTEIKKLIETLVPLGVKNFFLLTAVGMKEGIKKIEEETGAYVFSAYEYDLDDTVNSFDSAFYEDLEFDARKQLKERLEYYNKIVNPKNPLGYGAVGGLIVFYYNTPNSTLPVIWGSLNGWIPLFKRNVRINGIDSYYKQFDNLKSQKPKSQKVKEELTLFVEGKSDEIFFDLISKSLKDALGIAKLNVVSLGGFHSEKLIENLEKNETNYLFLIEDDTFAPRGYLEHIKKTFKDKPHVLMLPIIDYFVISSVVKDEQFFKLFSKFGTDEIDLTSKEFRKDFEVLFFKRSNPQRRTEIMKRMVDKHLNTKSVDSLIKNIKDAIAK